LLLLLLLLLLPPSSKDQVEIAGSITNTMLPEVLKVGLHPKT
jgi:hypothetical protein